MTDNREGKKIKNNGDRGKSSFMSGVAVLTLSTVVVKLIGVFYKIPMIKYLGEDGMGYFNSAYEIYTFFYIIATAGLPVAISIMVAKNAEKGRGDNVKRIFAVSMTVLILLGIVGSAVLYFGAESFARLIGNSAAAPSIAAIAPMALFVCVSGAIRGYFQGKQNMTPTAVSQIIEAVGKLMPGLFLAVWAVGVGYDIATAAAFATLGITIGVGISMLYLVISKMTATDGRSSRLDCGATVGRGRTLRELGRIALPITLSSAVISLTRMIDLVTILRRLQSIGYTEEAANAIYGSYSTLAVSMFNLPASLITPVSLALVPMLTGAIDSGNKIKERGTLNAALRLCGLMMIPAALGLSAFSRPILELVFAGEDSAINVAAPLLSVLAISVFFSCLMTLTNSILQAYGKERKPLVSMLAGAAVKVLLSNILIGIPEINIFGAPISTLACDITVTALNIAFIKKTTPFMENHMTLFSAPTVSAVLSVGGCAAAYYALVGGGALNPSSLVTLTAVVLSAVAYLLCVFRFGAVSREDMLLLPKGESIYLIMKKIKLMK